MSDSTSTHVPQEQAESSASAQSSQQQELPDSIHPDDAKDKVFTAILKALLKLGNKPSSPKELANVIMKYKYATLGGATPFATVSSRISQHFKRAAEHNPPRPPLLTRHFDEHHSRKINYSLATEPTSTRPHQEPPSPPLSQSPAPKAPAVQKRQSSRRRQATTKAAESVLLSDTSPLSSEDESILTGTSSTQRRRSRNQPVTRSSRRKTRRKRKQEASDSEQDDSDYPTREQDADDEEEFAPSKRVAKRLRTQAVSPASLPLSPVTGASSSSSLSSNSPPSASSVTANDKPKPQFEDLNSTHDLYDSDVATPSAMDVNVSDAESEADYSDYHEEMLKGDEVMADVDFNTTPATSRRRSSIGAVTTRRPSIAQATASDMQRSYSAQASLYNANVQDSPRLSARRQSFSLNGNGGFLGEELWNTNGNYEQDFDTVFLSDESMAHQISFHIATPESISVSELDQYFNGDNNGSNKQSSNNNNGSSSSASSSQFLSPNSSNFPNMPGSAARTTSRKSFCALPGSKETSLLQRALLASTARGMAEAAAAAAIESSTAIQDKASEEQQADLSEQVQEFLSRPRRRSWPGDRCSSGIDLLEEESEKSAVLESDAGIDSQQSSSLEKADTEATVEKQDNVDDSTKTDDKLKQAPVPVEHYRILKKTFGALECYQLDSPDDIHDTKILRFISSTDGATEHVALRTRHATDANRDRRNSQHFYLDEGYVNATQLRKAARPILGKGSFDASAETEEGKVVVSLTKGPTECRGAWVPLARARELAEEFQIASFPGVQKLLSDDPMEVLEERDKSESDSEDRPPTNEDKQEKSVPANPNRKQSTQMNLNVDDDDGEAYVKFEEDDDHKKTAETTNVVTNVDSVVVPEIKFENKPDGNNALSNDLFKSFNLQGINMNALQQLSSVIPNLSQLSNPLELAKALSSYMQSLIKLPQPSSSSSTSPASTSSSASDTHLNDFKSLLARLPGDLSNNAQSSSAASAPVSPTVNTDSEQPVVHTSLPTNPSMYITILDNTAVCVAVLPPVDTKPEYRIMRRLDSGYINGTELLTAGGIDTESERSMILSFELERVRVPKKTSPLYGTWIPLRRAQELAVTCSLQHRLGPFLSESIDKYFPSPLPITVPVNRRQIKHDKLPALNLPGLRSNTRNVMPSPIARSLSPPTPTATAAQLHQLLISNNRRAPEFTLKAPLLGNFDENDDDGRERTIAIIDCPATPTRSSFSTKGKDAKLSGEKRKRPNTEDGSDVDVVNSASEEDDDTDTDNDVEEVRKRMKKMRDAAIDAMGNGSLLDLEDLLRRASTPIMENPRRPSISNKSQRNGNEPRRNGTGKLIARRRPQGGGGKIAPSALKKSASWSGALASPLRVVVPAKKLQAAKKQSVNSRPSKPRKEDYQDVGGNRVVEHKSPATTSNSSTTIHVSSPAVTVKTESKTDVLATIHEDDEDDEDEEIDIGGSDRDDDLR